MKNCTYTILIMLILFGASCCTQKSSKDTLAKEKGKSSSDLKSKPKNAKSLLIDGKWKSKHKGGGDTMIVKDGIVYYTQRWDVDPPDDFPVVKIVPRFEENAIHLDFKDHTYTLVPVSAYGETCFVINPRDVNNVLEDPNLPKNIPEHWIERSFKYFGKAE